MDKLEGIKPGDRVRVTFEGVVDALTSEWLSISVDDGDAVNNTFSRDDINSPHFHIERIEKPLEVGDRVRGVTSGDAGEIVWMSDTHVVIVGSSHPCPLVKHISNVERVS